MSIPDDLRKPEIEPSEPIATPPAAAAETEASGATGTDTTATGGATSASAPQSGTTP